MKHVYIARHAEAAPIGLNGVTHDFDRPLTEHGQSLLLQQASGLKQMNVFFQACYSSPLLRAQQTAEALCALEDDCPVETVDCLGSIPQLSQVGKLLHANPAKHILLVTHQPFVVELTSWLLSGEFESAFHYSTASISCLRMHLFEPKPRAELMWFLTANQMAALASQPGT